MKNWPPDPSRLLKIKKPGVFLFHLAVLSALVFIIHLRNYDAAVDLWYRDRLARRAYRKNASPPPTDFVIVRIDDDSFNWLTKSFGSIRISSAKLIHTLKRTGGPRAIVVNFLFYGKGLSVEDIYLTAAADSEIPIFFRAQLTRDGDYFTPLEAFSSVNPRFGFLNPVRKKDDIVRKIKLVADIPNFGIEKDLSSRITELILETGDVSPPASEPPPIDAEGNLSIHFAFMEKDIPSLNADDLIRGDFDPAIFKDRIVVIDGTASVYQNKVPTPLGTLPESVLLVNAVHTQLHPGVARNLPGKRVRLALLFLLILLSLLFHNRVSVFQSLVGSIAGFGATVFFFDLLYARGWILPYTSVVLCLVLPALYSWIFRYFDLSHESRKLVRLASIDSQTGLYTFRYFNFLLQRAFIRQKKRKRGLYLAAMDFIDRETAHPMDIVRMDPPFLLEFGRLVRSFLGRKSIHGFSNDQNCCYLAFLNGSTPARRRRLEALRERSIALIMKMDLNLDVRVAAVDMEASRVPSSFQLVRILQFMLKQRIRQDRIIQEYQPSELSSSHPKIAPDTLFPETDLSYVSMQISEDRKDLDLTKKRLSTSIREYTMAQKLSAMGQLSSYYAHELKNPLHNLLNCFEILEDPGETEESREETMDLMKTELTRVVDLTRKMGSHFKPSDEKPDEVDLNELIESTLAFLERKFREHRVKTLFEKSSDLPMLYLVEDQFKQVFLNLFLNALEAMPDGGHLIVATFYVPPIVRITVTDTGMGIDALDLEKIFEAFYTTKKRKGTGLGLFACYNIIQHHGGSLKVNSTPGKGTCFEIILPT